MVEMPVEGVEALVLGIVNVEGFLNGDGEGELDAGRGLIKQLQQQFGADFGGGDDWLGGLWGLGLERGQIILHL